MPRSSPRKRSYVDNAALEAEKKPRRDTGPNENDANSKHASPSDAAVAATSNIAAPAAAPSDNLAVSLAGRDDSASDVLPPPGLYRDGHERIRQRQAEPAVDEDESSTDTTYDPENEDKEEDQDSLGESSLQGFDSEQPEETGPDICHCDNCIDRRLEELGHFDHEKLECDNSSNVSEQQVQCSVCFGELNARNPAIVLPCCGIAASSTSFCASCIVKCLQSHNSNSLYRYNYGDGVIAGHLVGECPRCRALLSVPKPYTHSAATGNLQRAAGFRAVRYAYRTDHMIKLLHTVGILNPYFLPVEVLENDVDRAQTLCRWGILKEIHPKVYMVDPNTQSILRIVTKDCFSELQYDVAEELVFLTLLRATWAAFTKYKLSVAIRLFNQLVVIVLVMAEMLPSGFQRKMKRWQGALLNFFTLFLFIKALQVAFIIVELLMFVFATVLLWESPCSDYNPGNQRKAKALFVIDSILSNAFSFLIILRLISGDRIAALFLLIGFGLGYLVHQAIRRSPAGPDSWQRRAFDILTMLVLIVSSFALEVFRGRKWQLFLAEE